MTAYRLMKDSEIVSTAKAGDLVYRLCGPDYGLARDDTRTFGYECISVTLNKDGSYPGFTVPVHDLEKVTTSDTVDLSELYDRLQAYLKRTKEEAEYVNRMAGIKGKFIVSDMYVTGGVLKIGELQKLVEIMQFANDQSKQIDGLKAVISDLGNRVSELQFPNNRMGL